MAKRRQSKSALIREALAQNPTTTAAEIVKARGARRVKVTPAHVYNVKAASGKPSAGPGAPATSGSRAGEELS